MRPIKLIVEGFTSFRTKQELDFTELDLFAITGATGAGKSSLLDAITYALYGKVARKSEIKELVSQGEKNLKVEFQFQVKQTKYKIVRTWRYRLSSPETKFLLDRFYQGQWERCDRSVKIENILGMEFDTFTRVILLPQGQFDEFLKGSAAKRREMLRNLGGFNIFEEMRKQASDRVKNYQVELAEVKGKIEGLQVPTDEEVTAKQTELKSLELNIPQLTENAANAQKILEVETRLFEQIKRLQKLDQDWEQIEAKKDEIVQIKQRLQQAQAASQLQSDWVQVQEIRKRFIEAEKYLQVTTNQFNQAKSKLDIQQENYDRIQAQADAIETQLETRGQDLATAKVYNEQYQQALQEINQAANRLKQKSQQYKDREVEVNKAQQAVTNAQKQLDTVNVTLAQTSPGGSRLEILDRVIPLIPQWEIIVQQKKTAQEKLDKIVKEKQQLQSEHTLSLNQLETSNVKLQEAQVNKAKIAQQNHAAVLRVSLHSGDDCPVCGGKYPEAHLLPSLPDPEIIPLEALEKSFQVAQQLYQQAQISLTQIETRLESLQQQEADFQQDLEIYQTQLAESQTQISTILDTEEWNAATLKQERKQLFKQNEEYKQALAKKHEFEAELTILEQSWQFSQTTLESAQEELKTAKGEDDHRQKQLQEIQVKLYQITQGKSYDSLKQDLEKDQRRWEERKQKSEAEFHQSQNLFTEAETTYKKANETLDLNKTQQEQLEIQWQTTLSNRSFTQASFQQTQATETKQQEWQEAIASHEHLKIEVSSRIQEIKDTIRDRTTDETALTNRREAKKIAEEQLQKSQKQQTELELWLKYTSTKQKQNQVLLERQAQVQQQEQIYQTLARDLKTDKFQAYILEHLERELVTRATVLLQDLTESRYALRIQEGEYHVEDNWNGGEMRRVRTLSGGETFAASLSMALSLSEKLSMGTELGCLFLDEGFGTLDRETLDSVTHILDSLRQQDRLIGVITHIPALAEQFTQIKVHKSQQGSNLVVEHC